MKTTKTHGTGTAILVMLFIAFSFIVGCGDSGGGGGGKVPLAAPQNLSIDDDTFTLRWGEVPNAASYTVEISGFSNNSTISIPAAGEECSLFQLTSEMNIYTIRVKANAGDSAEYSDSAQATLAGGCEVAAYIFETDEDGGAMGSVQFRAAGNGVTITGLTVYGGTLTHIVIPERFKGKDVTEIGGNAFADNTIMESVVISKTIEKVGDGAFGGNTMLKDVVFKRDSSAAGGVTKLGEGVFDNCNAIETIFVPEGSASAYETVIQAAAPDLKDLIEEQTKELVSISVTRQPTKKNYTAGEYLDLTGMEITAYYSDNSSAKLDDKAYYAYLLNAAGEDDDNKRQLTVNDKIVRVKYSEAGSTKTADITITVTAPAPGPNTITINGLYGKNGVTATVWVTDDIFSAGTAYPPDDIKANDYPVYVRDITITGIPAEKEGYDVGLYLHTEQMWIAVGFGNVTGGTAIIPMYSQEWDVWSGTGACRIDMYIQNKSTGVSSYYDNYSYNAPAKTANATIAFSQFTEDTNRGGEPVGSDPDGKSILGAFRAAGTDGNYDDGENSWEPEYVARGSATIANNGTLTVQMKTPNGTNWSATGKHYVVLQIAYYDDDYDQNSDYYLYTNGKTLAQVGEDYESIKYTFGSTTFAFDKFAFMDGDRWDWYDEYGMYLGDVFVRNLTITGLSGFTGSNGHIGLQVYDLQKDKDGDYEQIQKAWGWIMFDAHTASAVVPLFFANYDEEYVLSPKIPSDRPVWNGTGQYYIELNITTYVDGGDAYYIYTNGQSIDPGAPNFDAASVPRFSFNNNPTSIAMNMFKDVTEYYGGTDTPGIVPDIETILEITDIPQSMEDWTARVDLYINGGSTNTVGFSSVDKSSVKIYFANYGDGSDSPQWPNGDYWIELELYTTNTAGEKEQSHVYWYINEKGGILTGDNDKAEFTFITGETGTVSFELFGELNP